eukprot:TRINITY_DN4297_c0_g1_i2.p1 TRINITY_DN4297_c0_g1~~TRINITY_DN4297_c0_g1_i2.p1  ORF type:complete len:551 (-),score=169.26 TRINITY_DN4297_c0_g1_i2:13-1665(-)
MEKSLEEIFKKHSKKLEMENAISSWANCGNNNNNNVNNNKNSSSDINKERRSTVTNTSTNGSLDRQISKTWDNDKRSKYKKILKISQDHSMRDNSSFGTPPRDLSHGKQPVSHYLVSSPSIFGGSFGSEETDHNERLEENLQNGNKKKEKKKKENEMNVTHEQRGLAMESISDNTSSVVKFSGEKLTLNEENCPFLTKYFSKHLLSKELLKYLFENMQEDLQLTTRNINWKFEPVLTDNLIEKWLTQKNISNSPKTSQKLIFYLLKDSVIEEIKKSKNETLYQYFTPQRRALILSKKNKSTTLRPKKGGHSRSSSVTTTTDTIRNVEMKTKLMEKTWEELMKSQQKLFAEFNLKIPQVIIYLAEKIIQLGGKNTKGILRLSIRNDVKIKYIEQFKSLGYINLCNEKDCNVPAVLLKHFFGYSPLPLFENYDECINSKSESDYQKLVESLNETNKRVLFYLCNFMIEMDSVSQVTLMDISNLCLVFVPAFFKSKSVDVETIMIQQHSEQKFLVSFLKWIPSILPKDDLCILKSDEEREKLISDFEKLCDNK